MVAGNGGHRGWLHEGDSSTPPKQIRNNTYHLGSTRIPPLVDLSVAKVHSRVFFFLSPHFFLNFFFPTWGNGVFSIVLFFWSPGAPLPGGPVRGNSFMAALVAADCPAVASYDVCIVGAGPAGLAVLSSLHTGAAGILTEAQRLRAQRGKRSTERKLSVCVIDPSGAWLEEWRGRFDALDIAHLRSPAWAQPDAFSESALVEFAFQTERMEELRSLDLSTTTLQQLAGSNNLVHAKLFHMPTASLFLDFCDEHAKSLPHTFTRGKVCDVKKSGKTGEGDGGTYDVLVHTGIDHEGRGQLTTLRASKVVFAIGAARPMIPAPFSDETATTDINAKDSQIIHTSSYKALREIPWQPSDTVLVVGGGLSAVQAALLAVRRGSGRTVLCSRRAIQTQQYDLPLNWMNPASVARGAARARMFGFHGTSFNERAAWVKRARGGATVPQEYMRLIAAAVHTGRLELIVDTAQALTRDHGEHGSSVRVTFVGGAEPIVASRIVLGTGAQLDCTELELLRNVVGRFDLPVVDGLPVLGDSLQWGDERFTVVGTLASLQVGPDAGNLTGARRAAEVCAAELGVFDHLQERGNGLANPFDVFASDSDDESTDSEGELEPPTLTPSDSDSSATEDAPSEDDSRSDVLLDGSEKIRRVVFCGTPRCRECGTGIDVVLSEPLTNGTP